MGSTRPHQTSAARLAIEALGLEPLGVPWEGDDRPLCALEARPIERGEKVMPWKPGPNFMDDMDTIRGALIGGYAAALMQKSVMMKTQRMVFTTEGAYSLATDAARAWFYLTPPEPPFVAVIADSMLQHLVWRAPVNYSRERFMFRHGGSLMTVRRQRLVTMTEALRKHGATFVRIDREGKDGNHGKLRNDVPPELAELLADALPGELLALATLAKKTPPVPARPEPTVLSA